MLFDGSCVKALRPELGLTSAPVTLRDKVQSTVALFRTDHSTSMHAHCIYICKCYISLLGLSAYSDETNNRVLLHKYKVSIYDMRGGIFGLLWVSFVSSVVRHNTT